MQRSDWDEGPAPYPVSDRVRMKAGGGGGGVKVRGIYALGLLGSLLLIGFNHHEAMTVGEYWVGVLFVGPLCAGLCLAGIVDPAALWAIGKHGKNLPLRSKLIGAVGALLGVAGMAFLLLYYQGWI